MNTSIEEVLTAIKIHLLDVQDALVRIAEELSKN